MGGQVDGAALVAAGLGRLCLRLRRTEMLAADLEGDLNTALRACSVDRADTDVVLDLGADVDERDARSMIGRLPTPGGWRSVSLAGGEFQRPQGTGTFQVRRRHLPAWTAIQPDLDWELGFGDYGATEADYTHVEGYVTVVPFIAYTLPGEWLIVRGQPVNRHGWEQTAGLSAEVAGSPAFYGAGFSPGDSWIAERAAGGSTSGNSVKLVEVRTSHHIAHVLQVDLAS